MNLPWIFTALLLIGLVAIAGCSRSPEARKARHLARADGYFERLQYPAIVEYKNVLRIDGGMPTPSRGLASLAIRRDSSVRPFPIC